MMYIVLVLVNVLFAIYFVAIGPTLTILSDKEVKAKIVATNTTCPSPWIDQTIIATVNIACLPFALVILVASTVIIDRSCRRRSARDSAAVV